MRSRHGERLAGVDPDCETCDGDGYVDILDDWGCVLGPAPCPECSAARLDSGAAEEDA